MIGKTVFQDLFSHDVSVCEKPMLRYADVDEQVAELVKRFYRPSAPTIDRPHIHLDNFQKDELYPLFKEAMEAGYEQFFIHNRDELTRCALDPTQLRELLFEGVQLPHRHAACQALLRTYVDLLLAQERPVYDVATGCHFVNQKVGVQHFGAILHDTETVQQALSQQKVDAKAVQRAVQEDNAEACLLFLKHGVSPDKMLLNGAAMLHIAVGAGSKEVVSLLLGKGASVNLRTQITRATPLHWAAMDDRQEIAASLLQAGADVSAEDSHGRTPEAYATSDAMRRLVRKQETAPEEEPTAKRQKRETVS